MIKNSRERGEVLQSCLLQQLSGIDHFCTTRTYSNPDEGVWMPKQVHGTDIVVLEEVETCSTSQSMLVDADAVITDRKGLWIGIRTADCVPVLLCDPVLGVIAAVHAGWRGTVKHIVRLTAQRMVSSFGCSPINIYAMIGPSISPEKFEVGEEVADAFAKADRADCVLRTEFGKPLMKPHIDLWQSNVMDLEDVGICLEHIDCTPACTVVNNSLLFSARREGIGTGRIVSAICLKR